MQVFALTSVTTVTKHSLNAVVWNHTTAKCTESLIPIPTKNAAVKPTFVKTVDILRETQTNTTIILKQST